MGFRFRFKTLSQYRELLLKKEQVALARALRILEEIEIERARRREKLRAEADNWEKRQSEGMAVPEFLAYGNRIQAMERHLRELEKELLRLQREVEAAKRKVTERERDLKALSILEERERESYTHDAKKKEQGQIDEFAILRKGK